MSSVIHVSQLYYPESDGKSSISVPSVPLCWEIRTRKPDVPGSRFKLWPESFAAVGRGSDPSQSGAEI